MANNNDKEVFLVWGHYAECEPIFYKAFESEAEAEETREGIQKFHPAVTMKVTTLNVVRYRK